MDDTLPQVTPAHTPTDSSRLTLAALAVVQSLPDAHHYPWPEIAERLNVNFTNHEWPGVTVDSEAMSVLIRVLIDRGILNGTTE